MKQNTWILLWFRAFLFGSFLRVLFFEIQEEPAKNRELKGLLLEIQDVFQLRVPLWCYIIRSSCWLIIPTFWCVFFFHSQLIYIFMLHSVAPFRTCFFHLLVNRMFFHYFWRSYWPNEYSVRQWPRRPGFNRQVVLYQISKKWYLMPPCLTLSAIRLKR